jgi:type VI secretion system protein ImpL
LRQILLSRWSRSLVGTALLCAVVWYLGPLLPPLDDWRLRAALVAAMLAVWAIGNSLVAVWHLGRERALAEGVTAAAVEEKAAIESKIAAALQALRRTRGRRGYLYEQPWYAIIGPPGAGKTTALLNAELEFPLAAQVGRGPLAGVGGTRLCEWWFTDQAVLIDTAGRYTTHDSDALADRSGWQTFLDVLKRTRPQQPLNGVIVAIALNDITEAAADGRNAQARIIRQRIEELESKFEMRLPLYLIFTKADLLAGFSEFFDDLDRQGRRQVWGVTFPYPPAGAAPDARFAAEFRALAERIVQRLTGRLQAAMDPAKRALVVGFPPQLASMETALTGFIAEAFGARRSGPAPLLRGVYFTSATQLGTPIDRLAGAIARTFGLSPQRVARLGSQEGRSYFLTRLLHDVIFSEAMLVGSRRRRLGGAFRAAAVVVALLLIAAAATALWGVYAASERSFAAAEAKLAAYDRTTSDLQLDPVADDDLETLVPLLDQASAALAGDRAAEPRPADWRTVFAQDRKLAAAERTLYRHAIEHALFPRLVWRLEAQLRGNLNNPEFLYEATRVYLMLGGAGPLDKELVREWMTLDWQAAYPGASSVPLRASLSRHLDALLSAPPPPITLDGQLVAEARATFGQVSLAQRIYSRIRPSSAAQSLPPWRPIDVLGPAGATLFVRASGRSFEDGVPGFFTIDGFHRVLLPGLDYAVREVASESWVLGQKLNLDPKGEQARALERDVVALYENEYARTWNALLTDLNIVPQRNLFQAAQGLYILSSENSPMRALLQAVARQLTLSVAPGGPTAAQASGSAGTVGGRLQTLLGVPAEARPASAGHEVDDLYRPLRDLVGADAGVRLQRILQSVAELQQQLSKLADTVVHSTAAPAPGEDPVVALRLQAQRMPQPLARWLTTIADSGMALRGGDPRQQVIAAYNAPNGPAAQCAAAVNGHYPFAPKATSDIRIDDFTSLFSPGGVLDGFFNTLLKPYVDTQGHVWKPVSADNLPPPVAAAEAVQFQRAAQIRDLFFADGKALPNVRLEVAPIGLDNRTKQVTLDLGGSSVLTYERGGVQRPAEITWPATAGAPAAARFAFDPAPPGGPDGWRETGDWALLRLLGEARYSPGADSRKLGLAFLLRDRRALFEVRAGAATLSSLVVLQAFRCPVVQ